jgi:hypothetical protein
MRSRLERPSEVCPALGLAERFDNPALGIEHRYRSGRNSEHTPERRFAVARPR